MHLAFGVEGLETTVVKGMNAGLVLIRTPMYHFQRESLIPARSVLRDRLRLRCEKYRCLVYSFRLSIQTVREIENERDRTKSNIALKMILGRLAGLIDPLAAANDPQAGAGLSDATSKVNHPGSGPVSKLSAQAQQFGESDLLVFFFGKIGFFRQKSFISIRKHGRLLRDEMHTLKQGSIFTMEAHSGFVKARLLYHFTVLAHALLFEPGKCLAVAHLDHDIFTILW